MGLYVHSDSGGDAGGGALRGVLDALLMWARKAERTSGRPSRIKHPLGETLRIVADAGRKPCPTPGWCTWRIGKRDIRALIDVAARRGTPADWLIRSQHNRKTTTGANCGIGWRRAPRLGEVEFTCRRLPDRPARLVRQTLYRQAGDAAGASRRQPRRDVTAILARARCGRPAGQQAIVWRLLTKPAGRDPWRRWSN